MRSVESIIEALKRANVPDEKAFAVGEALNECLLALGLAQPLDRVAATSKEANDPLTLETLAAQLDRDFEELHQRFDAQAALIYQLLGLVRTRK
jgi:uncharacterized protein YgfB (UPF0149 family)